MTNVVSLKEAEIANTIRGLDAKYQEYCKIIEEKKHDLGLIKQDLWTKEARLKSISKQEKKELVEEIAEIKKNIKLLAAEIDTNEEQADQLKRDVIGLSSKNQIAEKQEQSESNVIDALAKLNANYVASDSKWYCIYTNGIREQPQVRVLTNETMKDMILRETGWVENSETTIKKIARDAGRMYRDVERTFLPERDGVLNQLNELRKFWLKPIHGVEPHPAFDILFNNLVGHDEEYRNQIEKYIAYRYIKPEDIFAPNIDSSAKGGAGRDTVFRILEIIFTEECCGEANGETFTGTHNGELWGKVWVKISERNAKSIDYNEFKNLTGGHNFRLRRMGENAIQSPRTFLFFIMNNGHQGTIQLAGTGSSAEDRRVEPIISKTTLKSAVAKYAGIAEDDQHLGDVIQSLQTEVWQNETRIAEWLGYIIDRHQPETISKILPLHKGYYDTMLDRQKNAFNTFMGTIFDLSGDTNCYALDELHKLYGMSTNQKGDKTVFGKRVCEWLTNKTGNDWEVKVRDIYYGAFDLTRHRRTVVYIPDQVQAGSHESKQIFDIYDFIEPDGLDDKGKELGRKAHINNIKGDLL